MKFLSSDMFLTPSYFTSTLPIYYYPQIQCFAINCLISPISCLKVPSVYLILGRIRDSGSLSMSKKQSRACVNLLLSVAALLISLRSGCAINYGQNMVISATSELLTIDSSMFLQIAFLPLWHRSLSILSVNLKFYNLDFLSIQLYSKFRKVLTATSF